MWQYMLDEDHFYDLRDLPVGNWNAAKLQMTKNSIWMHFHEPNSKKYYNSTNPIDFKKPYIPPSRTKKITSKSSSISSLSSPSSNSPIYVCNNNNFAITNDNLQIMNEEDAYRNPKPIIPVVGTYGQKLSPRTKTRSKNDRRSLKELASIPTTCRSVRTIRALNTTPNNATRCASSRSNSKFEGTKKQKTLVEKKSSPKLNSELNQNMKSNNKSEMNSKPTNDNENQKIYFSLKKESDSNQTEVDLSNSNTEVDLNQKSNLDSQKDSIENSNATIDSNETNSSRFMLNLDVNDDEIENEADTKRNQFIFVHSSQEDREAANAKRTLQMLERKERKFEPQIPSFTICGDKTIISNSADIDSNIATKKAIIFSDDLPEPPLYIDKRYGDNSHKNPLRISQIEIRKQFKEALDNGKLDDYDSDYEYEIIEEIEDGNIETRSINNDFYPSRPSTAKRYKNHNRIRVRRSARSKNSTVNARRNLYNTRVNNRNEEKNEDNGDTPMLTRKQYFNSASKIPNIGSLASDL